MTRTFAHGPRAVVVLIVAAACHRSPPAVASRPSGPNADSLRLAHARADSIARADAARRDSMARAGARADSIRRAAEAMRLASETARHTITAPVHFAFNQSDIDSNDRGLLGQKAAILLAHRAVQLRIEGNADERGSDEYNLALGMRRASAVRRYLMDHGVDSTRLALTSNGEERPVCQGHEESCWAQNRRVEFVITAGDNQIATHQ
jgi:peptidoglycan-associated lipoprotein